MRKSINNWTRRRSSFGCCSPTIRTHCTRTTHERVREQESEGDLLVSGGSRIIVGLSVGISRRLVVVVVLRSSVRVVSFSLVTVAVVVAAKEGMTNKQQITPGFVLRRKALTSRRCFVD